MKVLAVVAGNIRQFQEFIFERQRDAESVRKLGPGNVIIDGVNIKYISSPRDLRGLREFEIIKYGTYYYRSDLDEIDLLERMVKESKP